MPCVGRWPVAEPVALLALVLDAGVGWPAALYARVGHPVGGFARAISWFERRWNRPGGRRRWLGALAAAVLVGGTFAAGWAVEQTVRAMLGRWWWVAAAVLAWPALAQRSLDDHVRPIARALAAGDLPAARAAVSMIVGRDTDALAEAGVARAGIESLAESFCDGVVAPLFWLLLLGLPGAWAYKAINTADSLVGHREDRWREYGWASARADDLANLVPARLSAVLLCVAAGGQGSGTILRDHARHASPNAGWPEAAMAGALGVALGGPVAYDGAVQDKPWIGGEGRAAGAADVRRALTVYRRACVLLWLIAGGVAWAR